jgi:hypothetical protein
VDSTGTPDPATFEVHDASHPMNGQAVRDILPSWRFRPALKDGHPVRMRLAMTIPVEVGNHVQTTNTDRALPSTKPTP